MYYALKINLFCTTRFYFILALANGLNLFPKSSESYMLIHFCEQVRSLPSTTPSVPISLQSLKDFFVRIHGEEKIFTEGCL